MCLSLSVSEIYDIISIGRYISHEWKVISAGISTTKRIVISDANSGSNTRLAGGGCTRLV
jgi:hypothetical protein